MVPVAFRRTASWLFAVAALAFGLVLATSHDHQACAHDTSTLCVPDSAGQGDLIDKGNYPADAPRDPTRPPARSARVQVLAHVDPGDGFNADVVAHSGHAYLGSWGNLAGGDFCPSLGVRVFDLSDPSNPVHVSTFADGAGEPDVVGSWTEKVQVRRVDTPSFQGDLAAVSFQNCLSGAETFRGFGVYDVTDPANPDRLALVATDSRAQGSHEIFLDVRRDAAYVYTAIILSEFFTAENGEPGQPDFQIWDVSDPSQPAMVGEWGAWAELGVPPVGEDSAGAFRVNFVHSVIADGRGTAHLSYWDLGTVTLDVSDPTSPTFVGRTEFRRTEEGNAHSAWIGQGGNLLVQTDEDFNPFAGGGFEESWGYARLYDISDPADPKRLSTFEMRSTRLLPPGTGFFTVHDPKIRGNRLYLSYYSEGVVVLDIARPSNPRVLAQFVPGPSEDPRGFFFPGEAFPFVWGVWVERDYVLASDINSGLWVFRVSG